jgi:uncharacterized protein (DUF2345 family)
VLAVVGAVAVLEAFELEALAELALAAPAGLALAAPAELALAALPQTEPSPEMNARIWGNAS